MPKVKPTWVCQHCERQFTTKYSLMRHFKRFPEHSPPNLSPGDGELKPITVQINDHVRTVTAIPLGHSMAAPTSAAAAAAAAASASKSVASTSQHDHGTRFQQQQQDHSTDATMVDQSDRTSSKKRRVHPGSAFSLNNVSDIEESPSDAEFESPANGLFSATKNQHQYPFLPPFLEDEQILDIATPQQLATPKSPPPPAAADPIRLLASPTHYSWSFSKEAEPGLSLLSPLAPACTGTNFRQIFQEDEEKLRRLTTGSSQENHSHNMVRSPVELAALDKSLLLGDEEATSPLNFLKSTSQEPNFPVATSLDFLSPPYHSKHGSLSSPATNEVSMDDLDLTRFYAPMV